MAAAFAVRRLKSIAGPKNTRLTTADRDFCGTLGDQDNAPPDRRMDIRRVADCCIVEPTFTIHATYQTANKDVLFRYICAAHRIDRSIFGQRTERTFEQAGEI